MRARRNTPARAAGFALSVALFAAVACHAPDDPRPLLVLLYAPCTVNKHFLSPYAPDRPFTPHLERFAGRATVFRNHRTDAGSSGTAYASLFSGTRADHHGVFQHPAELPDDLRLIAEAYAENGYETFFWNEHSMASPKLNYGQGVRPENSFQGGLEASDSRFLDLLKQLASDPDRRAFVMTNFTVTHGPYSAEHIWRFLFDDPEREAGLAAGSAQRFIELYRRNYLALSYNSDATLRRLGLLDSLPKFVQTIDALYASNVSELDRLFGAVLDAVDAHGLTDQSLIVFTADHGEVMYREHEPFRWTHSRSLAREVLDVPLLVAWPGREDAPASYTGVTRSIDVFPTMMGLSGLAGAAGPDVEGRDLSPVLLGREPAPDLVAFSHTTIVPRSVERQARARGGARTWGELMRYFPRPDARLLWVSMQQGGSVLKLRNLDGWRFEMFDRATDPWETIDVFDPDDAEHSALAARLEQYKKRLVASDAKPALQRRRPSDETQEKALRALGYIE